MKKKQIPLKLVAYGFIAHISTASILCIWLFFTMFEVRHDFAEIIAKVLSSPVFLLFQLLSPESWPPLLSIPFVILSYVINSLLWGFAFAFIFTFLKRKLSKNNNSVNPV
jgi:hypothetical protein